MLLEQYAEGEWEFRDPELPYEAHEAGDQAVDFWHSGQIERAEKKFLSVIRQYPTHIDAMHHYSLFLEAIGRETAAYMSCRAAVGVGLHAIPSEFSWDSSQLHWGLLDNRPFMRAYHNLGLHCLRQDRFGESEKIFKRLLSVNPNDNQGVRYLLPKIWFSTGRPEAVVELCQKYDDPAPEISYSLALAYVLLDQTSQARMALDEAVSYMPLVRAELLKKRHDRPRDMHDGYITHGGRDQAYVYWQEYGGFWRPCARAMELLLSAGK